MLLSILLLAMCPLGCVRLFCANLLSPEMSLPRMDASVDRLGKSDVDAGSVDTVTCHDWDVSRAHF